MTYLKDVIEASKKRRDAQIATRNDLSNKLLEAKTDDQALFTAQKPVSKPNILIPAAEPQAPAAKPVLPVPEKKELELPPADVAKAEEEGEKQAKKEFEQAKKTLVEEYNAIKIYKVENDPMLYYTTSVSSPKAREVSIINTLREAATRLIAIKPYDIRDPTQRRYVYFNKILDIIDSAPELGIPPNKREFYAESVVREMVGYGKIDPLVQDEQLEEIMVIAPKKPVYVFHRKYEMMKTNVAFYDDRSITDIIDKIARMVGRRVDLSQPILDARLPDGSRVNATVPPISLDGPTITIRKFRADPYSLVDLLNFKTISPDLGAFLWLATEGMNIRPANVLVAGGTGSGKTTILNVLSSLIPSTERVITLEQTAELQLPIKHWIRFETRPPSLEGAAEIDMNALVINSLRMRPDRIIVGEVRGNEASTLFTAMNTGHQGSAGTIHANSAKEAQVRITSPPMSVPELMLSGLDFIIVSQRLHEREKGTIRRITEVAEVKGVIEGKTTIENIFQWDPASDEIKRTGVPSEYLKTLQVFSGMSKAQMQKELDERKNFLLSLKDGGIRKTSEVAQRTRNFIQERN